MIANADEILDAITNSDFFKNELKENPVAKCREKDIKRQGYPQRYTDYYCQVLDWFFEQDLSDILEVKEVWSWLSEELRKDLDGIWKDKEAVMELGSGDHLHSPRSIGDIMKWLEDDVTKLYAERLSAEWKGLTVEQATKKLKKKGIYVALLDENWKITREPFPAIMRPSVKITAEIKTEKHNFDSSRWLHINFEPQQDENLDGEITKTGRHSHMVRREEMDYAIITKA